MTIDEAIEILSKFPTWYEEEFDSDDNAALKLGIEAMKSVRTGRKVGLHYEAKLLPGETKE